MDISKHWIKEGTALSGTAVSLLPLEESHFSELEACANDARIWEFFRTDYSEASKMHGALERALELKRAGLQYPFAVRDNRTGNLIGSTRLMDLQPEHLVLEIGFTWYKPAFWQTVVNPECKLLLLTFSFETLMAARVTIQTDVRNVRSRKAIEKLGTQYEGKLRSNVLRENGTRRDSVYYSILAEEWNTVKDALLERVSALMSKG